MVEKKIEKTDSGVPKQGQSKQPHSSYTMNEVFKITDDLFTLSKEREYPLGAFVHGLIFALEFAQQSYHIPPQQIAEIKRDCRRYVDELVQKNAIKDHSGKKKK
jgi:hypothetical protein